MNRSRLVIPLLCLSTVLLAQSAQAYERGDTIFRAGPANVSPNDSSGTIHLNNTSLNNTGASVEDNSQLGITLAYMLGDQFAIELLVSTPFEHQVNETGVGIGEIATVKHLPPTLSGQYYPMDSNSAFQPYVGLGINYTVFFSEETSDHLDATFGESDISLDNSWGIAIQLGADYRFDDKWSLNAAVWRIDIDTEARIDTPSGEISVDIDIDPWVAMAGVAYQF